MAQVNGRNDITWEKRFEYDLQYIKNITLFIDIKIILKTIYKVFKRENIEIDGFGNETLLDEERKIKPKITN